MAQTTTHDIVKKIEKFLIDYSVANGSVWHYIPADNPEDVKRVLNDEVKQFLQEALNTFAHSVKEGEKERIGYAFSKWFLDDDVTIVEDAIARITGIYPQRSTLNKYLLSQGDTKKAK